MSEIRPNTITNIVIETMNDSRNQSAVAALTARSAEIAGSATLTDVVFVNTSRLPRLVTLSTFHGYQSLPVVGRSWGRAKERAGGRTPGRSTTTHPPGRPHAVLRGRRREVRPCRGAAGRAGPARSRRARRSRRAA